MLVVVALFVFGGFSAGVQAASGERGNADAASLSDQAREVTRSQVAPIRPPSCNPANAERYIRCLDRYLTNLARNLNRAIDDLAYYNDCIQFVYPFSLYGIPPTEGFVYRPPAPGADFLMSAWSLQIDPGDTFIWVPAIEDTQRCVEPA
jgi:hypothetical protein